MNKEPIDEKENPQPNENENLQLDPWGQGLFSEEDYERLTREFGIELIQDLEISYSMFEKIVS